jgi:ATP-dependent helicase HepA
MSDVAQRGGRRDSPFSSGQSRLRICYVRWARQVSIDAEDAVEEGRAWSRADRVWAACAWRRKARSDNGRVARSSVQKGTNTNMGNNVDLEGLVFLSREFGYCKVTSHIDNKVRVHFAASNREAWYTLQAIGSSNFDWCAMPVGLKCRTKEQRLCTIAESSFQPNKSHRAYDYLVVFDGEAGETARLTERDLWPLPESLVETPLTRLLGLQADPLTHFRAREGLLAGIKQIDLESANVRALAAARVALLPHQAFVVGTVIDDPIWRYILADEVGLGKTIEAGAIAHQLLSQKPDARVLVLSPGPLARQWLCEMRQSFGGRGFRLLDLHDPSKVSLPAWPLVISSLKNARRHHGTQILATPWDLVIVDEAHQLLWNDDHYAFVARLAANCPRILLLSAVPARERDVELLRLLRLIDPQRYQEGGPIAQQFSSLYIAQPNIGRRLRIIARQLDRPDEIDLEQVHEDVVRLLSLEALEGDGVLQGLHSQARNATQPLEAVRSYQYLVDQVVSRYRINRRILKNRRARLVESELLSGVNRSIETVSYEPSPLEAQISAVALDLLQSLAEGGHSDVLHLLFRKVAQALCDPVALYEIASSLASAASEDCDVQQGFDLNSVSDYYEHEALLEACAAVFANRLHRPALMQLVSLLRADMEQRERPRVAALKRHLEQRLSSGARKIIVFAGTVGTAEYLSSFLATEFGRGAMAAFRHDLSDEEKEKEATKFQRDLACRLLVSDESGGEGRNFQFADELVHFDLPWSVATIEQRVGRLDRIGRDRPVRSVVICPARGLETEWRACLESGFGVFSRSISGLEFMLRGAERLAIKTTLEAGALSLVDLISEISEACERERAVDDAEALTDAASFRKTSRYLRAHESVGEGRLEQSLPSYLQAIGRTSAAKRVTDAKDPNLKVWLLRPEEVTEYELLGMARQDQNPLHDRLGTFSRLVARDRPDLDFFSIGHPLVDALLMAAHEHVRGRTVLAEVQTDLVSPGVFMLSAWRVQDLYSRSTAPVPERALRMLGNRVVWCVIDIESNEPLETSVSSHLVRLLLSDSNSIRVWSRAHAVEVLKPEPGLWSIRLDSALERASMQARAVYDKKYRNADVAFCDQLLADAKYDARVGQDEAVGTEAAIVEAISGASLAPDVVGLVRIKSVAAA